MNAGANLRGEASDKAELIGNLRFSMLLEEAVPSDTKWKKVKALDAPLAGRVGHDHEEHALTGRGRGNHPGE